MCEPRDNIMFDSNLLVRMMVPPGLMLLHIDITYTTGNMYIQVEQQPHRQKCLIATLYSYRVLHYIFFLVTLQKHITNTCGGDREMCVTETTMESRQGGFGPGEKRTPAFVCRCDSSLCMYKLRSARLIRTKNK